MRTVRLFMTMSCDGCVAGPNGELDWMTAGPDPEMNRDVVDLCLRHGEPPRRPVRSWPAPPPLGPC